MELPEPRGADELLAAMEAAQSRFDPDAERRLLSALATAELLVPLVTDPDGRTYAARLAGEDGAQALVAFTHAEAVEAFHGGDDVQIGVTPAVELAATAIPADTGLVINPAGPHAGQLDRRALDSLVAAGSVQRPAEVADPESGFELRAPSTPLGADLVERLRAAITLAPTLREAWHAEVVGAGPVHGLLVLVGDGEEPPEAITDLLSAGLPDGEPMDLLPVEAAAWDRGEYAQVSGVATLV